MTDGKVKYRRPTQEELELLREPVLTRVGGCDFPSCVTVFLTPPDIVREFSANVYQGGLNIGDEVYIVCIKRSGSNKLMAFTKEMLNQDIYSWFKY